MKRLLLLSLFILGGTLLSAQTGNLHMAFCNGQAYLLTSKSGTISYGPGDHISFEGGVQAVLITPQVIADYNLPLEYPVDVPTEKWSCSSEWINMGGGYRHMKSGKNRCGPVYYSGYGRGATRTCGNTNSYFCSGIDHLGLTITNDDCEAFNQP